MKASPRISPDLAILLLVVIWGVNFSVVKWLLEQFNPLALNGLRFALGALVLVPFVVRGGGLARFERRDWLPLSVLGVVGNLVYQILFVFGIDLTLAGNAALMLAMSPMFVTLLSAYMRHESIRPAGWFGVVFSTGGIACVLAGTSGVRFGAETLIGDLVMLGAAVAWAIYTVGASPLVRRHGALPVTAVTMWIGAALLFAVSVPSLTSQDWSLVTPLGWTALVLSGSLAVGLSYVIWYHGVEHLGSARTAVFSNTVPIVALVTAWLALGETPGPLQLFGAALIIAGVLLTRLRGTERAVHEVEVLPDTCT
ncbi:MAG TPA: DMT family transporter [Gemmatimonadota bacterium]|nr:DMT family transporter [Gemmatimonadota bacterium]